MKYVYLLALLFLGSSLVGQITVTSDIYPMPGDTLRVMNTVNMDTALQITPAGPDQIWNYDTLSAGPITRTEFISIEDTDTMVAGAVSATPLPTGGFIFYGETDEFFGLLAFNQSVPIGGLPDIFARYGDPLPDYYVSLEYQDSMYNETRLISSALPGDLIPQDIIDSLMLPVTPDSLRVEQDYTRISKIDAWGTLSTPTGTYEVLRERRENLTIPYVAVKAGFFPWVPIPLSAEPDTAVQYVYWSNQRSEPILVQNIDSSGGVGAIQYYTEQRITAIGDPSFITIESQVYPNPVNENQISIDLPQSSYDDYQLEWYDGQGRRLKYEEISISGPGQTLILPDSRDAVLYLIGRSLSSRAIFQHRIMISQ